MELQETVQPRLEELRHVINDVVGNRAVTVSAHDQRSSLAVVCAIGGTHRYASLGWPAAQSLPPWERHSKGEH
jgi:hypothetical protein